MKLIAKSFISTYIILQFILAADTFTIANGITVETTGGVYIQLKGDLVETGTGYLKGIVTSGPRTGVTSFAGLSLSAGMDGTITRNTGTEYAGGNGEGTNVLRYYELNNTGSAFAPDVSAVFVNSGVHDEQNGLSGPYFIYNYDDPDWNAYGDGSSASPLADNSVALDAGTNDLVFSEGLRIAAQLFLEGAYLEDAGMSNTINASIPLTSPYSEDPRTAASVHGSAVDWVLVEVRATTDGTPLGYRSCFLSNGGNLMEDDWSVGIGLPWIPGSYYLVIRHRNHLAIMNSAPEIVTTWGGTAASHNFSTAQTQAFGTSPMVFLETNTYGMYAGDANSNATVNTTDYLSVLPDIGLSGYYDSDCNLNNTVNTTDYLVILPNVGKTTQVP
ncbi:hypothetical protein ACFLZA_02580 [Candidatus Neomarinimicrobiota bacterium]